MASVSLLAPSTHTPEHSCWYNVYLHGPLRSISHTHKLISRRSDSPSVILAGMLPLPAPTAYACADSLRALLPGTSRGARGRGLARFADCGSQALASAGELVSLRACNMRRGPGHGVSTAQALGQSREHSGPRTAGLVRIRGRNQTRRGVEGWDCRTTMSLSS